MRIKLEIEPKQPAVGFEDDSKLPLLVDVREQSVLEGPAHDHSITGIGCDW